MVRIRALSSFPKAHDLSNKEGANIQFVLILRRGIKITLTTRILDLGTLETKKHVLKQETHQ